MACMTATSGVEETDRRLALEDEARPFEHGVEQRLVMTGIRLATSEMRPVEGDVVAFFGEELGIGGGVAAVPGLRHLPGQRDDRRCVGA